MREPESLDITAQVRGETEKAFALRWGQDRMGPKSQVEQNPDGTFTILLWLANEKDHLMDALATTSPFLPATHIQYAWDSTYLGYLKTCPRLYQYIMIEGWQSQIESVHLRFGIEYHHALQDYDLEKAAGIRHDDAVHDVVRELVLRTGDWDSDHKTKNRESLVRTVIWYLDHYRDDTAETLILSDGRPAVEQSFRFELDYGVKEDIHGVGYAHQPYVLCGHLDKIVRFNDELFVMDHKTTSFEPSAYYFSKFEPDNQMTLYSIAAKVVLDAPVRGVIIDAAQVKEDWSRFGRGFTFRTPDQLEEWLADLRHWLNLAEQYATAGYWPQNDTACDKFGGCRFRDICSKSPIGAGAVP